MLTQILEKNNITLVDCSKKKEGGSNSKYKERVHCNTSFALNKPDTYIVNNHGEELNSKDRERVHALVAGKSSSPSFIIDSGASRHMVLTK